MQFTEHSLELSIIELLENEGYAHLTGNEIHHEKSNVLLDDVLANFLLSRYSSQDITTSEINSIIAQLKNISSNLYDENRAVLKMICNGFTIRREDKTKKDLFINLINFEEPEENFFLFVNQLEIQGREHLRIPDGIIYVNGIPLVVMEFKSAIKENTTIEDAHKQLTVRYRRDIPELFKYNAFVVISDGVNSKMGTIFSDYEYFFAWRKIEENEKAAEGIGSLITMIKGLFAPKRFVGVLKDFIYFPDTSDKELKIVCRYPQYFAAVRLFQSIKSAAKPNGDGKGGIYFGATGCGKSYTMVFLARLLMRSKFFNSPTILVITDRTDLDDQLSEIFLASKEFIGDQNIICVESRQKLKEHLQNKQSGGIYLTTIQKFSEDIKLLSDRSNIICISDEAHRSQNNIEEKTVVSDSGVEHKFGFAKYLHESLPNATFVGFTGTPIDLMEKVFGDVVDKYTLKESVADGITVNLVYEGRAAKVFLDREKAKQIEEYYSQCENEGANEYQIEQSKKAVANLEAIIGDDDVINAVAADFIQHYENRVQNGATLEGKAMFVCSSREIAYSFYKAVIALRPEWNVPKAYDEKSKPIEKIKMVMTESKSKDEKDLYELLGNQNTRKEFDRQFKDVKSNFKIAVVVDMWITGFDVPCLDTIYIYKPLQRHTLIQTISRVNRVYKNKENGLIVDYIGIKKAMNTALRQYTGDEEDEFKDSEKAVNIVKDQLDILKNIFAGFDSSKYFSGTSLEQLDCLRRAVEFIQSTDELEKRFMNSVKKMKSAFNLCTSSESFSEQEKDLMNYYIAIRSVIFKYNKIDAPDITQMNKRVSQMVQEAIKSDGVEELFAIGKHVNFDLFSEDYLEKINKIQLPNTKIKLLQQLLKQVISEYKKKNKIKGVEFSKRLDNLIAMYNDRHNDEFSAQVLDEVTRRLNELFADVKTDEKSFEEMNIDFKEKVFFDILEACAKKFNFENDYPLEKMKDLAKKVKALVAEATKYTDWNQRIDVKAEMKADLRILLDENGYPPVPREEVFRDVFEQAENFKKYAGE